MVAAELEPAPIECVAADATNSESSPLSPVERISQHLDALGLVKPDLTQRAFISGDIQDYLQEQLALPADERASMLETELYLSDITALKPGEKALVIGMGGSNIYWQMVSADESGKPLLMKDDAGDTIGGKVSLKKKIFSSPTDFAVELIQRIEQDRQDKFATILDTITPDAFGFVFSYPHKSYRRSYGIDVIPPDFLPKNITINGASQIQTGIGEIFYDALRIAYGHREKDPDILRLPYVLPIATRNDAELTEVYAAYMGLGALAGVLGTGMNFSMLLQDEHKQDWKFINMEAGAIPVVLHQVALAVDHLYTNAGEPRLEKLTSGRYMGDQMKWIIDYLNAEGLLTLPLRAKAKVDSKTISDILSENTAALRKVFQATEAEIASALPLLIEPAERLRDISAAYTGTFLATTCMMFPHLVTEGKITIPMEGSVIQYMPGHQERVEYAVFSLAKRFGPTIEANIYVAPDASILGGGIAAMSQSWRHQN